MLSCQRCKGTHHGPPAFLLTCRGCHKTWHHRCHMPPIEDNDLIRRIHATNEGDSANDLAAWACRRCQKGAFKIASGTSSREATVSSDAYEDKKSVTLSGGTSSTRQASSTSTVDTRSVQDRRQASTAPVKHAFIAKRVNVSAVHQPPVQTRRGEDPTRTIVIKSVPRDERSQRPPSPIPSYQDKNVRTDVLTTPIEDVKVVAETPPPISIDSTSSRASPIPLSDVQVNRLEPVADVPPVRANNDTELEQEVRPIQPQLTQGIADEVDDDPDDLYGPDVERRIIRILPSLAEELRAQQRAAPDKEKLRAPLAPDWILAKHAHESSWKVIPTKRRKQRKVTARQLGDNGLNVGELMDCWVRPRKYDS